MIDRVYVENFRRIIKADILIRDGITVLAGLNGTGKSTIIEAILFNHYGQSRQGTLVKSVLRINAENKKAYTCVDFHIGDIFYRCRRFISQKDGSDKVSSNATLYKYSSDEYDALLDADITQENKNIGSKVASGSTGVTNAIIDLYGLSYDGYKASLVANQKELDSLANLTKEKKKKFFLDLLGYSRIDNALTDVRARSRDNQNILNTLAKQLLDYDRLKKDKIAAEKSFKTVEGRIQKGTKLVNDVEKELESIQQQLAKAQNASETLKEYQKTIDDNNNKIKELEQTIADNQQYIKAHKKELKAYKPDTDYVKLITEKQEWIVHAGEYVRRKNEISRTESTLAVQLETINTKKKEAQKLSNIINKKKPDVDIIRKKIEKIKDSLAGSKSIKDSLEKTLDNYSKLLTSVENGETGTCPNCGSDISTKQGITHLKNEIAIKEKELDKINVKIEENDKTLASLTKELNDAKNNLNEWNQKNQEFEILKTELELLEKEHKQTEAGIASTKKWLQENKTYDCDRLGLLKAGEELEKLKKTQQEQQELAKVYQEYTACQKSLTVDNNTVKELKKNNTSISKQIDQYKKLGDSFPELNKKNNELKQTKEKYLNRLDELNKQHGEIKASIQFCSQQIIKAKKQREEMSTITEQNRILESAKTLISQLRVELPTKITPTLSESASRLLAKATDNAYSMIDIDEEYNVNIYTDMDVMTLSMMSGGEQDITSLCIRIAIAEMILSSTGIDQQTMILDEIFGSLDDTRKQSACNALKSLTGTLPRILCITHIDEIKDLADWRYVVEKNENGYSTVREITDNQLKEEW